MFILENRVIKGVRDKKIYFIIAIQLIFSFILCLKMRSDVFSLILIFNFAVLVGIFLIMHETLLLVLTLMLSFTVTYLIDNIGLSSLVKYGLDYCIILVGMRLIIYFVNKKIKFHEIYIFIILLLILTLISFSINGISINEYIKKLYFDYLRYFIIFISVISFDLKEVQIKKVTKILWYLLLAQVPLVIFQDIWSMSRWHPVLPGDIRQDYLSGILGGRGNTELGLLITIALTTLFVLFLNKKVNYIYFVISLLLLVTVLVIGEIKFIFFILPITMGIVAISKLNIKSISMGLVALIILSIGIKELGNIYTQFNNFTNIESIEEYIMTPYAGSGLSRGDSFIIAGKMIQKNFSTTLVGYGVSNATSIVDLESTPTEFQKSHKYRFTAFNISQYIIELGYVGILNYYGIFITILIMSISLIIKSENDFRKNIGWTGISAMFVIITCTFYNMSMEKVNFAIFAWMLMGIVCRYNYLTKDESTN